MQTVQFVVTVLAEKDKIDYLRDQLESQIQMAQECDPNNFPCIVTNVRQQGIYCANCEEEIVPNPE